MAAPFKHLKAVVFDWAGTTVDYGSRAPALVFREIFRREGVEISFEQARGPMGLAKRDHIAAILQLPEIAARWEQSHGRAAGDSDIDRMYHEFLPLQKETLAAHCDLIPGVSDAVAECRRRGLRIGSTTGYTHELVDVFAARVTEQGYSPDCVICADDVPQGRPAPWMLLEAARQLDAYPLRHIVKVDDTAPGIEAAINAGCWAVGVTRTGNEVGLTEAEFAALPADAQAATIQSATEKLMAAGAHFTIESVADLGTILDAVDSRL
ncbi:phosphonoacetaldehyde hydrolase [bacterium]|nr:phosphonoacetaldehyde hydrolase [bacterium]